MTEYRVRLVFDVDVEAENPSAVDAAQAGALWLDRRAKEARLGALVYDVQPHDGEQRWMEIDLEQVAIDNGGHEEPAPAPSGIERLASSLFQHVYGVPLTSDHELWEIYLADAREIAAMYPHLLAFGERWPHLIG